MAHRPAELHGPLDVSPAEDRGKDALRRCRGRPRLTDSDRAQRRLESRKKYDVRRVYLGESHKLWSELRRRTSLSDAGLAEYLILLNSTYGEKYRQDKPQVSSLQSLVCWYQEHSRSCPHEPQLRALEPHYSFSTAAIWQCDSKHSFVQYLVPPPREASDSEHEDSAGGDGDGESAAKTDGSVGQGAATRKRRKEAKKHCKGLSSWLKLKFLDQLAKADEDGVLTQSLSGSVPLGARPELGGPPPMQEQAELFDPQANSLIRSSVIFFSQTFPPFPPASLQLIIITGPSYEALASEGIQLNMGGGGVEEVTCTVIGGVSYNPVCTAEPKLPAGAAEESEQVCWSSRFPGIQLPLCAAGRATGLMFNPPTGCVGRSKRSRRGPVIEADGMLKMFHCPYEGCSQVYVAISSFQNHVNLVHRKGRTKVCPHPGCGKKFYLSNHLHRHMIIHSGVRDFICETCGKSFKRKNHLEVHRRTHTGETPLQCEICGYQCRQRASLNWHMKKHTPEAHYNFTCEFCDKRFEKLDSVKFHKLKSHPDKLAT
uniref:Zinc finger protein 653 n=1 Tax=Salarias fasciatus TaxID=181472 RepID=A0A672H0W9_SALFA